MKNPLALLARRQRPKEPLSVYLNRYQPIEGKVDAEFIAWLISEGTSPEVVEDARRVAALETRG
jgi:hypothetical protein